VQATFSDTDGALASTFWTVTVTQTPAPSWTLQWDQSVSAVEVNQSFTLDVHISNLNGAGDHGGISVSFPSLDQTGASSNSFSSSKGNVVAESYSTGLSRVQLYDAGDTLNTSSGSQISANHLLVETDDASWSSSSDRTLRLRITPKVEGNFTVKIRGWVCLPAYSNCFQRPQSGATTDQQGWQSDLITITVYPSNTAPTASRMSPSSGNVSLGTGDSQTFTAQGSDSNSNLSGVVWRVNGAFDSGLNFGATSSCKGSIDRTFTSSGTYTVQVTFSDTDGASDSASWTVNVSHSIPILNLTAHSPQTIPFEPRPIEENVEGVHGAGIRINGDDDNNNGIPGREDDSVSGEDDLIMVSLTLDPPAPPAGIEYVLKRSNNRIKVWGKSSKDSRILDSNNETVWNNGSITIWVENPRGGKRQP
jgi:hypothetical protein